MDIDELNEQLALLKDQLRHKEKWERRLTVLQKEIGHEEQLAGQWLERLQAEEKDVDRLKGLSLFNLFYTVLGTKDEKLQKEKEEVLAAKLKYDEAAESVSDLKNEYAAIRSELARVQNAPDEYERLLREKEAMILDRGCPMSDTLYSIADKAADLKVQRKELDEAIHAGEPVLRSLNKAEDSLKSAQGWGTFDMLGGGAIATAVKHGRIDDARVHVHEAQTQLRRLEKELQDVNASLNIRIEMGGFATFADFFFDGLISDWIVQGRINDSLHQVRQKHGEVGGLVRRLQAERDKVARELAEVERTYASMIEQYEA